MLLGVTVSKALLACQLSANEWLHLRIRAYARYVDTVGNFITVKTEDEYEGRFASSLYKGCRFNAREVEILKVLPQLHDVKLLYRD